MAAKIAFFGGTFDPVHHGHLIVARAVAEQGGFDSVMLVPTCQPPHKAAARANPRQRLAMLTMAVEGEPLLGVCPVELERPGPSYTYQTLETLRERYGAETALHWVVGADMLEELHLWRRIERVLELAGLVVAVRPPWDRRIEELLGRLAGRLGAEAAGRVRAGVVSTPLLDISSTEVRGRILRGASVRYLVPEGVEGYIRRERLYVSE